MSVGFASVPFFGCGQFGRITGPADWLKQAAAEAATGFNNNIRSRWSAFTLGAQVQLQDVLRSENEFDLPPHSSDAAVGEIAIQEW